MAFPRLRDGFDSRYPLHSENSAFWLIFELCSKSIALALEFSLSRPNERRRLRFCSLLFAQKSCLSVCLLLIPKNGKHFRGAPEIAGDLSRLFANAGASKSYRFLIIKALEFSLTRTK